MKSGVYFHLPFCAIHCSYCDFPISTRLSLSDRYYEALHREIDLRPPEPFDTLYFGGGTPSLTPATVIREIKKRFALQPHAEVTLEANPDDITERNLEEWQAMGINRLSLGVQTLEETALRVMRRKHTVGEAIQAIDRIHRQGFLNVNFDLIIGTPEQTVDGFLNGLHTLVDYHPQHFSLYLLELHERTLLYQLVGTGTLKPMEEDAQVECYRKAIQMLREHGYEHYEVSNFAVRGYESRHNLKYWTDEPYYGYGAGACAYIRSVRIKNVSPVQQYIEMLERGQLPVEAQILEDAKEQMRNAVIFGLRKREGINLKKFEETYGIAVASLFQEGIDSFLKEGYLEIEGNLLRLTLEGVLVSNEILCCVI